MDCALSVLFCFFVKKEKPYHMIKQYTLPPVFNFLGRRGARLAAQAHQDSGAPPTAHRREHWYAQEAECKCTHYIPGSCWMQEYHVVFRELVRLTFVLVFCAYTTDLLFRAPSVVTRDRPIAPRLSPLI